MWSDCGHDGQLFQQHDAAGFAGPAVYGQNSRLDGGRQQSVFVSIRKAIMISPKFQLMTLHQSHRITLTSVI